MKPHINQQIIRTAAECCEIARSLEDVGDLEGARRVMEGYWLRVGERPNLTGLVDDLSKAEVLLRVGYLTGRLGSVYQVEGAQQLAQDFISESQQLFASVGRTDRVLEGYLSLATCYNREGKYDNARALLKTILPQLENGWEDLKARTLIRLAIVEKDSSMLHDAYQILSEHKTFFEGLTNHTLQGMFRNESAIVLRRLAKAERRPEYYDLALIEYAGASYHYEQAGNLRFSGAVLNNLAFALKELGRFQEAHEYIARAQSIAFKLRDKDFLGQWTDTQAQILIAEGRYTKAVHCAQAAVNLFLGGDNKASLAEAWITLGIAHARTQAYQLSREALSRAALLADEIEDRGLKANAFLTLAEELPATYISDSVGIVKWLLSSMRSFQDASLASRAIESISKLFESLLEMMNKEEGSNSPSAADWEGFSLDAFLRRTEAQIIEKAMIDAGGSVRKASKLLGLSHHQTLHSKLNNKHQKLLDLKKHEAPGASFSTKKGKGKGKAKARRKVADERPRMFMPKDSLSGTGIPAESWLVLEPIKWSEVKPSDLIGIKTLKGDAAGYYNPQEEAIFLDPHNLKYKSLEFDREEITELVGKVVGWHPSDAFDDVTPV